MTTQVKDIFKDKKYPKWFSNHPIFKEIATIKKVFPSIGLPNFIENAAIDNSEQVKKSATDLLTCIENIIANRIISLRDFSNIKTNKRKTQKERCDLILNSVFTLLNRHKNDFIQLNNNRISLKLPDNISIVGDNRPIFRKNESLFRVYNKLIELLQEGNFVGLQRLEDTYQFKTFSSENIPNNNQFKIVFSSDGVDGAWDIATMSMRGIQSCQNWNTGEYKHCTIGSVIDPFVAIMYLTSGEKYNEYGSKMIRRSIVRFIIDGKTKKPYLHIDNMYPSIDNKIMNSFKNVLKKKTNNKFEIKSYSSYDSYEHSYIPLNSIREKLKYTSINGKSKVYDEYGSIASYQDTKILSKKSEGKDEQLKLFTKNSKKKELKFTKAFNKYFIENISNITEYPKSIEQAITKLKNSSYINNDIANLLAKSFLSKIDKEQFTNSDTYIRRVYYSFFNYRKIIINENKSVICKKLNGFMHLAAGYRFGTRNIVPILNSVFQLMEKQMKEELKKIVKKRQEMKIEPLPLP